MSNMHPLVSREQVSLMWQDERQQRQRLEAQLRDVTAERDRVVRALAIFADAENWQRWTTEIGADRREVEVTEWQGEQPAEPWKIARDALDGRTAT